MGTRSSQERKTRRQQGGKPGVNAELCTLEHNKNAERNQKVTKGTKRSQSTRIYISTGNRKVICNCFSLPSTTTCKPNLACNNVCYAKKAERQYPHVLTTRKDNYRASKNKNFVSKVYKILKDRKMKTTRVHEGGDYYSKEYVRKWYEIARMLPEMQFYSYTKRNDIFDKKLLGERPANFRIHWSVDKVREDNEDVSKETQKRLKQGYDLVAVMRETKTSCLNQIDKEIKCIQDCKICLQKNRTVDFKKH